MTIQLGNISLGLTILLLVLKGSIWSGMPWAVVLAPFWIPFCGWGLIFGAVLAWMLFLLIIQLLSHLLSTTID